MEGLGVRMEKGPEHSSVHRRDRHLDRGVALPTLTEQCRLNAGCSLCQSSLNKAALESSLPGSPPKR